MAPQSPPVPRWASRRVWLWLLLLALLVLLLGLLVWLAGRYESSMVQARLEHNAAEAAADVRAGLNRNLQVLQALHARERSAAEWAQQAGQVLHENRELLRLESRGLLLDVVGFAETPFRPSVFQWLKRDSLQSDVALTCGAARRLNGAAYSASYFLPQNDGLGMEVMDMCLPLMAAGRLSGYAVATYSLQAILPSWWASRSRAASACPSPRPTARAWRCSERPGAAAGCSWPSSCWTCRATRW